MSWRRFYLDPPRPPGGVTAVTHLAATVRSVNVRGEILVGKADDWLVTYWYDASMESKNLSC
jgi:hypothetical protein